MSLPSFPSICSWIKKCVNKLEFCEDEKREREREKERERERERDQLPTLTIGKGEGHLKANMPTGQPATNYNSYTPTNALSPQPILSHISIKNTFHHCKVTIQSPNILHMGHVCFAAYNPKKDVNHQLKGLVTDFYNS